MLGAPNLAVSPNDPPFSAVMNGLLDAAVVVDPAGHLLQVNQRFRELAGVAGAPLDDTSLNTLLRGPFQSRHAHAIARHFAAGHTAPLTLAGIVGRRGRRGVRCRLTVSPIAHPIVAFLVVFRAAAPLPKPQRRRLRLEPARIDSLTGLASRAQFVDDMARAVERAHLLEQRLVLLIVGLDRFREVNEGHGHDRGDAVLIAIARRFTTAVRSEDHLCRWGGDEFACLLVIDGPDQAPVAVAERLLAAVALPVDFDDRAIAVGASIGFARLPEDALTASELVAAADRALDDAKAKGGMQWQAFTPAMTARARERSAIRDELSRALHGDELQLFYQPLVDARTLMPIGVEALIRWVHPRRGILAPSAFLTLLTSSPSRARQLLEIQIARARAELAFLEAVGGELAINFDARLVGDDAARAILEPLRMAMRERGMWLMVELTESAFNEQPTRLRRFIDGVREDGVRLAIDDFGGGQASLLRLREITFDVLKVDRALIRDLEQSPRDRTISALAAKVAGELSGRSVAEGLETAAQIAWAQRLGYHALQGFRIARPMPAAELANWLRVWRADGRPTLQTEIRTLSLPAASRAP